MSRQQFKIKHDAVLKNRLTNETVRGNIINERDIEGKSYWVMTLPARGLAQLSYSKDSWTIVNKGK